MIIGVPKETKTAEYRVAITPGGVRELTSRGHTVLVEHHAGEGSTILDEEYEAQGAVIVSDTGDLYADAEMVLKVKEPQPGEFDLFRPGQILFTFLHLAAYSGVADRLREREVVAIAYETVQLNDGTLPLLAPMSEVAGRMAIQAGAHYLEKAKGGRGILLGGVSGVQPAKVVILGGGVAGSNAAAMAIGLQANVTVLDLDLAKLRRLDFLFPGRVVTLASNQLTLEEMVLGADLVVGAVLVPGKPSPKLVSRDLVRGMRRGSVLVDVAIDQGGCFETSRETTHDDPVYSIFDVVHYAVGNIPGAVPHTSTHALANTTIPYVVEIADHGVVGAIERRPELIPGVNLVGDRFTNLAVAESLGEEFTDPLVALKT